MERGWNSSCVHDHWHPPLNTGGRNCQSAQDLRFASIRRVVRLTAHESTMFVVIVGTMCSGYVPP